MSYRVSVSFHFDSRCWEANPNPSIEFERNDDKEWFSRSWWITLATRRKKVCSIFFDILLLLASLFVCLFVWWLFLHLILLEYYPQSYININRASLNASRLVEGGWSQKKSAFLLLLLPHRVVKFGKYIKACLVYFPNLVTKLGRKCGKTQLIMCFIV